jgi:hypothetical protein
LDVCSLSSAVVFTTFLQRFAHTALRVSYGAQQQVGKCYFWVAMSHISDKRITKQSKMLEHMATGHLILADKGFLIQDILPNGVYVNKPPFLQNGKFTESEVKATTYIAKCRIHVERANARLKDCKILSFIPHSLRCHADIILQLCAALVNLQFPLIKEGCEGMVFE